MLSGKRIILGVTGGIAAYKSVYLLRALQKAGAEVRVTLSPSATRFVGIDTFSAISRHEVPVEIFPDDSTKASDNWVRHVEWGEWADLFIIAPCTANTLAKLVHGISDTMLTTTALSIRCPLLICPTMDGGMYQAGSTQQNLKKAHELGFHLIDPGKGYLASGLEDIGRLPDTETIIARAEQILKASKDSNKPLSGKTVVVTAGPTREFIDPVRFLSNPSSGKMGFAMAQAAHDLGADVTLLHGPVSLPEIPGIKTETFISTDDLFQLVKRYKDADIIIMAAAVSDFKPAEEHKQKVKKDQASTSLPLQPTQDILHWLGERKAGGQVLIGFAMETENIRGNAKGKLTKKNLDYVIANSVTGSDSAFMSDSNSVTLIGKTNEARFSGTKMSIAFHILEAIF
ncbi:MAG: bifunctional phosphopantothenoylcysteine decarboxylase/phosphopantothenate--cysteine ligase CoaBC [Balneolales bacterium]